MTDFGTYIIITQPYLSYTSIAERCVAQGVRMLQLREKYLSDKELLCIARDIRSITQGTETSFVINDRPDIALLCNADYLHLGQDDFTMKDARKIVGDMKIGLSTHSIEQAKEALKEKPDYIGFGPVFRTTTKAIADEPVGTDLLKKVLSIATVPVVAIGGIFPENIQSVIDTGAKNIAMVRYFMQTDDFDQRVKNLNERLKEKK